MTNHNNNTELIINKLKSLGFTDKEIDFQMTAMGELIAKKSILEYAKYIGFDINEETDLNNLTFDADFDEFSNKIADKLAEEYIKTIIYKETK